MLFNTIDSTLLYTFLHLQKLGGEYERSMKLTNSEHNMVDCNEPDAEGDEEKKRDKKQERQNKYSDKTAEIERGKSLKMTLARFLDNWRLNMSTRTPPSAATTSSSSSSGCTRSISNSSSKNTSLRDINITVHNACNSGSATPAAAQSPREGELVLLVCAAYKAQTTLSCLDVPSDMAYPPLCLS